MPRRQHRPVMKAIRARLPRRTVRLRLTVLYGGLFLAAGAALLAITYVLVERASSADVPIVALPSDDTVSPDEDPTSAPPRPGSEPTVNESESGNPPGP